MFRRETPNPISLNQRVLGSSPSASTIFSNRLARFLWGHRLRKTGFKTALCWK